MNLEENDLMSRFCRRLADPGCQGCLHLKDLFERNAGNPYMKKTEELPVLAQVWNQEQQRGSNLISQNRIVGLGMVSHSLDIPVVEIRGLDAMKYEGQESGVNRLYLSTDHDNYFDTSSGVGLDKYVHDMEISRLREQKRALDSATFVPLAPERSR